MGTITFKVHPITPTSPRIHACNHFKSIFDLFAFDFSFKYIMHGHIRERKEIPNDIWHSNFAIYIHIVDKQHRCLFWVTNKGCSANVWEALGDGFCLAYLLYLYVPSDPFSFLTSYVEFELYLGFIVFLLLYIVCI